MFERRANVVLERRNIALKLINRVGQVGHYVAAQPVQRLVSNRTILYFLELL